MFKLLSPLVKDQTDQPTEPVSWYIIVLLHLCFLKEVFSLSLCVCVLTNPITHLAPKYENLYMYIVHVHFSCVNFICTHLLKKSSFAYPNPVPLFAYFFYLFHARLCNMQYFIVAYIDCNFFFFSDNFSLMQRILQRSSGLWADLYTSSKPTA